MEAKKYKRVNLSDKQKRQLIEQLMSEQEGKCYLCGSIFQERDEHGRSRKRFLDHNHETGAARKLLCHDCNSILTRYESYASISATIEWHKKQIEPRRKELEDKLDDLQHEIEKYEALRDYIRTGECTPHIFKNRKWPYSYAYMEYTPDIGAEYTKQLNDLALTSTENYQFMREYMRQAHIDAAKECIKLLEERTKGK